MPTACPKCSAPRAVDLPATRCAHRPPRLLSPPETAVLCVELGSLQLLKSVSMLKLLDSFMARGSAPRLTLAAAAAALRWALPSRSSAHKLGVTPRVCAHRCPTLCERVETRTASEIPSQTPVSRTETRTAETQTETRTASEIPSARLVSVCRPRRAPPGERHQAHGTVVFVGERNAQAAERGGERRSVWQSRAVARVRSRFYRL